MPPRFSFWTILIDNKPTAFRAREREELLPTFKQLQARNPNAVMKWFARGRIWDSPEAAREDARRAAAPARMKPGDRRDRDWRPGGAHRDPRARFKPGPKRERRESWQRGEQREAIDRKSGSRPPRPQERKREDRIRFGGPPGGAHSRPPSHGARPDRSSKYPGKPPYPRKPQQRNQHAPSAPDKADEEFPRHNPPPRPPGPDRPPKPGNEPLPDVPAPPERIGG
jgi:hypothetical protein